MKTLGQYLRILVASVVLILVPAAANASTLSCSNGAGYGELYESASVCSNTTPALEHVFSIIACNFVEILDFVLDQLYCGIQYTIQATLAAALTLYVAVFGTQILMGTAHLNAREILLRLLKIAGVWTFATQSTWGIGMAFQFFLSLIGSGIYWVTSVVIPFTGVSATDPIMPVYGYLDQLVYYAVTGPFTGNNAKLIGFFAVMGYTMPFLFAIAGYWLWLTLVTLARSLMSFLLGISAIAFLISLSPLFLSFMLFKATYVHFESWLRYMLSYSVQIIIIFGVLALWLLITSMFMGFFDTLSGMIYRDSRIQITSAVEDPDDTWGICYGSTAQCNSDPTQLIPPSRIPEEGGFIYFVLYNLVTLSLVAFAFSQMMKHAPALAQQIVGPAYAPVLGGGWGNSGMGRAGHAGDTDGFNRRHGAGVAARQAAQRSGSGGGGGAAAAGNSAEAVDAINKYKDMANKMVTKR